MARFAENTSVSVENSRAETERTLQRYGAESFAYGWDKERAVIEFQYGNRRIRFILPLPNRDSTEFKFTPARKTRRTEAAQYEAWEQACRQRWRALNLAIKAKLEAVEAGISTFDEEFQAHLVMPDNRRLAEVIGPQIDEAYASGMMPPLLALGSSA